ncbi:MAG: hypothetical protein ACKVOR_04765 [Flavobacteriales bacterium]
MKKKIAIIACTIAMVSYAGCCTKKDCRTLDDLVEIQLVNFAGDEVDSLTIEIFSDSLTTRLDSVFSTATISGGYMAVDIPGELNLDHFYRITNHSTGQSDVMGHFNSKKLKCNTCFPNKTKGYITTLDNYVLNGDTYNEEVLSIAKRP